MSTEAAALAVRKLRCWWAALGKRKTHEAFPPTGSATKFKQTLLPSLRSSPVSRPPSCILHPVSCWQSGSKKSRAKEGAKRRAENWVGGSGGGSVGGPVTALGWHKCAHGARQKVSWQEPGLPKRKWLVRPWNGKGMVGSGWLGPGLLSSFPSANGGGRERAEGDVLYFLKMSSKIWTLYPGNGSCSICKEVTQGAGSTAPARPPSTKHSVDMDMNVDLDGLIKAGKQQRQETRTTTKRGRAPGHRWNVHTSETGHTQHRRKSCSNAAKCKY